MPQSEHSTPILAQNDPRPHKPRQSEPMGPIIGASIVVVLLIIGALYFWGAELNRQPQQDNLPFITGDPVVETLATAL